MTFLLLQEVRWRDNGNKLIQLDTGEKFEYHWCGFKKKREAGVGILIRVNNNIEIQNPSFNDPRIMGIDLKVYGLSIQVVNAYSPTELHGTDEQKRNFYAKLNKVITKRYKNQKLIISGDFNATTSVTNYKCNFDGKKIVVDTDCNDNGNRLKTFCISHQLSILSTFFKHRMLHRYTWYSNDKRTKKVLDYVLAEKYIQNYTTDCRVYIGFQVDTDHKLLKTTLNAPTCKSARRRYCKNPTAPKVRYDIKSVKNPATKILYTDSLNNSIPDICKNISDINELSNTLVKTLQDTATQVLPTKTKREKDNEIWKNDQTLNKLLKDRAKHNQTSAQHKKTTKQIKKYVRKIKNQKFYQEALEINHHATRRETEELFRTMKSDNSSFIIIKRKNNCESEKLKTHFSQHFNPTFTSSTEPEELKNLPKHMQHLQSISTESVQNNVPDKQEIIKALKKLKNGKAANDIPSELLKYAVDCEPLLTELKHLIGIVWKTEITPSMWSHTKLVALWKGTAKESSKDPSAYRGLQIGSTLCKLTISIILDRLKSWYDEQLLDQQQGFRSARGTTDAIYITKRVQQISESMKMPVYVLFIDLRAAFDHIVRSWLFKSVYVRFPKSSPQIKLIKILEAVYKHTTTSLAETPDDIFELFSGVRQVGPESPPLYNLYMDFVMRVFNEECEKSGIKFLELIYRIKSTATTRRERQQKYQGKHKVDWVGYADDVEMFFETAVDLQKVLSLLDKIFKRFNLNINVSKTKTIIFNFGCNDKVQISYPESFASLSDKSVENIKSFNYLGDLIKYNESSTGDAEIELRITLAEAKFYELVKKLTNLHINLKTRVLILNSLVRSRLTYSCQTWNLNDTQNQLINTTYRKMLRRMIRGGFQQNEDYHYKITNLKLHEICKTEYVSDFVARQQVNYCAHLVRQQNTFLTKRLLFNDNKYCKRGRRTETLKDKVLKITRTTEDRFHKDALNRKFRHEHPYGLDRQKSSN